MPRKSSTPSRASKSKAEKALSSSRGSAKRSPLPKSPVASRSKSSPKTSPAKPSSSQASSSSKACPVEGCDGSGALDGVSKRHHTELACPRYHRLTQRECAELAKRRPESLDPLKGMVKARAEARQTLRRRAEGRGEELDEEEEGLEPPLEGFAAPDDLALFRNAQGLAGARAEAEEEAEEADTTVELGRWSMRGWFPSEYPERLRRLRRLFVCRGCLKCVASRTLLQRHTAKCVWKHPPGNEVYRDSEVSFWEVEGRSGKLYCQNLCLLAKLFLDHKTLYYDVAPFLFYVMTRPQPEGHEILGYFSKERESMMNCNLSCLLTLPAFQKQGYGRLLIHFSYLLSQRDGRIGSPEHPLSDMGLLAYRSYWSDVILQQIADMDDPHRGFSFKELSLSSGVHVNDIVSTLQLMGLLKYWKGEYILKLGPATLQDFAKRRRKLRTLEPEKLVWNGPPIAEPNAA